MTSRPTSRPAGAADLLAAKLGEVAPPVVTFQVTNRCNYACTHCYQQHGGDELSLTAIERILDQLVDAGILFLSFVGGEFFMRRDADEILALAHRRGFALRVLTTGHHIDDARADRLASLRPLQIDLSVYAADPRKHDTMTTIAGSWRRTLAAAERLVSRGVIVRMKSPVMTGRVDDLPALAKLAERVGAVHGFDPFVTVAEDGDPAPLGHRTSDEELGRYYAEQGLPEGAELERLAGFQRPVETTPCHAGAGVAFIAHDGSLRPCNRLPIDCGSLTDRAFSELWAESPALARIRSLRWSEIEPCRRCELRRYCNRCHANALLEDGELRGPSREACRHATIVRDHLRAQGLLPADDTALPPPLAERPPPSASTCRPASLRIIES